MDDVRRTTPTDAGPWVYYKLTSRAANSIVHGRIWPNFEIIQALTGMYIQKCLRKRDDAVFPIITLWVLSVRRSRADYSILCGPISSKCDLLLDTMLVLNTYKFKMDQINSNRENVATSMFMMLKGS